MKFKLTPITKIDSYEIKNEVVYDIEVEDNHSFCVTSNNTVVHNSVCTTRIKTGVGYSQLSAIIECADAAHGMKGHVCADGGCTTSGDVVKAFAAGADFVMLGGMLAGTDECEGIWVYNNMHKHEDFRQKIGLQFYGMSSKEANDKYNGGLAGYKAAEGKCITVPCKGPVKDVMEEIFGGLRSACTYVGCDSLKDLCKCTTFVRVNRVH